MQSLSGGTIHEPRSDRRNQNKAVQHLDKNERITEEGCGIRRENQGHLRRRNRTPGTTETYFPVIVCHADLQLPHIFQEVAF